MSLTARKPEMQEWRRLGRIFVADGEQSWMRSHAYLPTAHLLTPSSIRVYLGFRDSEQRGRIGYVDVSAEDPTHVLDISPLPCLDLGAQGRFDEDGVSPLSISVDGDRLLLLYAGWQRVESVRYLLFTGLAESRDGGYRFQRCFETPILDRIPGEAVLRAGGLLVRSATEWRCYYMGGNDHLQWQGRTVPTYSFNLLRSKDPGSWSGPGKLLIAPDLRVEFGFGRPAIIRDDGRWKMWLSVRTIERGYQLEYAESDDGEHWRRLPGVFCLTGDSTGWDSDEVSFASVVDTVAGRFLFYNGNNYGATGFGVARLERP